MQQVNFRDLGTIGYNAAWELQERLLNEIVSAKKEAGGQVDEPVHHMLFCEHPNVYTLGKSGDESNLLISDLGLKEKNAEYIQTNRGGDITFHGPGQIVGYPVFDLDFFFHDIHRYLRSLEEVMIRTLDGYGIKGERIEGLTGVWVDADDPGRARKICAFGVRCSRWVTMHGFALNVNTDLSYFENIIPCGISDKQVTSIQKETGKIPDLEEVKQELRDNFSAVFNVTFRNAPPEK